MKRTAIYPIAVWLLAIVTAPPQAVAGGFERSDPSSKGLAMAGAFVAQAEDPSALFYNVGALGLLDEDGPNVTVGLSLSTIDDADYRGLPPGVGAGEQGRVSDIEELTPHAFGAFDLGERTTLGLGLYSPFGFEIDWAEPDEFAGRYESLLSELDTLDLAVGIAYEAQPNFALGASLVYRSSDFSFQRRLASFDPAAGSIVDVASLVTDASDETGLGFTAGVLWRSDAQWSLGVTYRSSIDIDYGGGARLTQILTGNAALDALIAATVPFDEDLAFETGIEFPESATLGLAFAVGNGGVVELDVDWTGWSRLESIALLLPDNPEFDEVKPMRFSDTLAYRVGGRFELGGGGVLRAGIALDETPQPDEAVGPFFYDSDRLSYSLGYGKAWLDLAITWVDRDDRQTLTSASGLNGIYSASEWTLVVGGSF